MKNLLMLVIAMLLVTYTVGYVSAVPIAANNQVVAQMDHSIALDGYQNFSHMLSNIQKVVFLIGGTIVVVMWVWEGIFMLMHRDDKEGILKFKHDLIYLVIASLIVLGASVIVSLLQWIVTA